MDDILKQILSRLDNIDNGQKQILDRLDNLEGQTRENTNIIKAIQHNTEVLNAKLDGLTITTASKDAIAKLDAKFDVLNTRLFQQEAEIHQLKAIK